jgi:hypothetical protein
MDKYVDIGGRKALTSPNFVIFHEGRYYVTVAVLEFDPNAEGEASEGAAAVRQMFESAQQSQSAAFGLEAAAAPPPAPQAYPLSQSWGWTEQSSDPPPPPNRT